MEKISSFFANPFVSMLPNDAALLSFTEQHLLRLIRQNTEGRLSGMLRDTMVLYAELVLQHEVENVRSGTVYTAKMAAVKSVGQQYKTLVREQENLHLSLAQEHEQDSPMPRGLYLPHEVLHEIWERLMNEYRQIDSEILLGLADIARQLRGQILPPGKISVLLYTQLYHNLLDLCRLNDAGETAWWRYFPETAAQQ